MHFKAKIHAKKRARKKDLKNIEGREGKSRTLTGRERGRVFPLLPPSRALVTLPFYGLICLAVLVTTSRKRSSSIFVPKTRKGREKERSESAPGGGPMAVYIAERPYVTSVIRVRIPGFFLCLPVDGVMSYS